MSDSMNEYIIILSTCGSKDEALSLGKKLVETKLAACVQLSDIKSIYVWDNQLNTDDETRLLIKTSAEKYDQVEKFICDNHSYEVPQIIQIPIQNGLESYLNWIDDMTEE